MNEVTNQRIAQAVNSLLAEDVDLDAISSSLAAYLIEERRTGDADNILRQLDSIRSSNGIREVILTSAFAPSDSVTQAVRQVFYNYYGRIKTLTIKHQMQPEVIGGFRAETSDALLDFTIASRLQRLTASTINED